MDCLVVEEASAILDVWQENYPWNLHNPDGDSQTIDTYHCRNNWIIFSETDIFASDASKIGTCTAMVS